MEPTSRPVACSERMAVSRPEPGPLTNTSTLRTPCSWARRAAASAAICAANGVDLREPLNPTWPELAHAMTAPEGSVIDTIVLLKVLLMCACPWAMFFFSLRRTFLAPAVRDLGGTTYLPSSCRPRSYAGPSGYEHWCGCADRGRAFPGGDADPGSSRSRPCGGCLRRPHDGGHLRCGSWPRCDRAASRAA